MRFLCLINGTPRNVSRMKFEVDGERAALVGIYRDGVPYAPNKAQFRATLPYRWRKAFDRSAVFWLCDRSGQFSVTLRDRRGKYLATIYAGEIKES